MKPDFKALKSQINLIEYAIASGYKVDQRKSTRRSASLYLENEDRIVVSRMNDIWVYFSVYDAADNGTIIDFVKNRTQKSLYEVGQELQSWNGSISTSSDVSPDLSAPDHKFDAQRIARLFQGCQPLLHSAYLQSRGIDRSILVSKRFRDRIFQDYYLNAVFPHFEDKLVTGLELRNAGLKLFVRGSVKSFWRSNVYPNDDTLAIAESAIDTLSYYALYNLADAFMLASSGGLSPYQSNQLSALVDYRPNIKSIRLITDNDIGGDRLAEKLFESLRQAKYRGQIDRHSPEIRGQDWNDYLLSRMGQARSLEIGE